MTQFEVATAAGLRRPRRGPGRGRASIEAGLGGRLDATNTIPSRVTVLTSIGLDHTEWLGETEARDRRREAGGAARPLDPGRSGGLERRGRGAGRADRGRARGAADPRARGPRRGASACARRARFQRRNFALARAAAEAFLGELDPDRGRRGRRER